MPDLNAVVVVVTYGGMRDGALMSAISPERR